MGPSEPDVPDESPGYAPALGVEADSRQDEHQLTQDYFPPLLKGIWELSPDYIVPRTLWDNTPGYNPGPSPGYNPIPSQLQEQSPGYTPRPSPGYAPVPPVLDHLATPRTPESGFSEIVGPIVVPEVELRVETVRIETNHGPCVILNLRRILEKTATNAGTLPA
ncbi:hypothetical protein R1sor_012934 [Riccia sorocarpa]|uniref:Uncharacterized protein n=1 Tax=Riccia sorocarpa TaxID=122646 RepID=A0ABD3I5J1_9MARC